MASKLTGSFPVSAAERSRDADLARVLSVFLFHLGIQHKLELSVSDMIDDG